MYANKPIIISSMFGIENAFLSLKIYKIFVESTRVLFEGGKMAQNIFKLSIMKMYYHQLYSETSAITVYR